MNKNMIETFNMTLPPEGPGVVPITIEFEGDGNDVQEIDLSQIVNDGVMSYISGVTIDCFDLNDGDVIIENAVTGQRQIAYAGGATTFPLYAPNPPKFTLRHTAGGAGTGIVRLQFVNFPVFPFQQ